MLENIWFIAAVWMGLALIGSLISIRTGISVALVEILVGVIAGNFAVGLEGGTLHIGIAGAGTNGPKELASISAERHFSSLYSLVWPTPSRATIDGVDQLPGIARQWAAHVSRRSGNRSHFAEG
jgi:Kef-type K+ transport system membrane component KefB